MIKYLRSRQNDWHTKKIYFVPHCILCLIELYRLSWGVSILTWLLLLKYNIHVYVWFTLVATNGGIKANLVM